MTSLAKFNTTERANDGVEIELKDLVTGLGSGAYITIFGMDGEQYAEAKEERARDMLARSAAGQTTALSREERVIITSQTLARCTKGWRNLDSEEDGKPIVFSYAAAVDLYKRYPAIADQVNEEIARRANFVKA
jgi:hypothetical protein